VKGLGRIVAGAACLGALLAGGCAQLSVRINVMDPAYLKSTVSYAQLSEADLESRIAALESSKTSLLEKVPRLARPFDELIDTLVDEQIVDTDFEAELRARSHRLIREVIEEIFEPVERARAFLGEARSEAHLRARLAKLEAARLTINDLGSDADEDVSSRIVRSLDRKAWDLLGELLPPEWSGTAREEEQRRSLTGALAGIQSSEASSEVTALSESLSQGFAATGAIVEDEISPHDTNLTGDPLISVIAGLPRGAWDGLYNRAYGGGFLGNADIAIKLDKSGKFSVKGVRLDAAQVTRATFSGAKTALQVAAASYGIPIPLGSAPAEETEAQDKIAADAARVAAGLEQDRARLARRRYEQRAQTLHLLDSVALISSKLDEPGSVAPADLDALKSRLSSALERRRLMFAEPSGQE